MSPSHGIGHTAAEGAAKRLTRSPELRPHSSARRAIVSSTSAHEPVRQSKIASVGPRATMGLAARHLRGRPDEDAARLLGRPARGVPAGPDDATPYRTLSPPGVGRTAGGLHLLAQVSEVPRSSSAGIRKACQLWPYRAARRIADAVARRG